MLTELAGEARRRTTFACALLTAVLGFALAGSAAAATQTREDPSDAPDGPFGNADLRAVGWDVADGTATLTVSVDASTYPPDNRAEIGLHVLLDTTGDGIADADVAGARAVDGTSVDIELRTLTGALSEPDCQDLNGALAAKGTVPTTIAAGLETFSFTFKPADVPGGLAAFRWAVFAQAPPDGEAAGPWDLLPDAANPDPNAANPGDRRCDSGKTGRRVRLSAGVAFPDADPEPTPSPSPSPSPAPTATPPAGGGPVPNPIAVLSVQGGQPLAGSQAILDASATQPAPGTRIIGYRWDFDSDGHYDAHTGAIPIARLMMGARPQTVTVQTIDNLFHVDTDTVVVTPPAAARGCEAEASIGALRIRAACIRRDGEDLVATGAFNGDRFRAEYEVSINGIPVLARTADQTIRFHMAGHEIIGHGVWKVKLTNVSTGPNGIELYQSGPEGFNWPLPTGAGRLGGDITHIVTLEVSHECEPGSHTCAEVPGGFPITGGIDLGIDTDTYEAVIGLNAAITTPITVTGRIRLRFDVIRGMLIDSLGFGIENATFGVFTLEQLRFDYEPPGMGNPPHEGDQWDVAMSIILDLTPPFRVAGRMIFVNGRFSYGDADVTFSPGIPIYAGAFLNRFAAAMGIDPLRIGGGLGINIAQVVQLNGDWTYLAQRDGLKALRMSGDAYLLGSRFADMYSEYWSDGYFAFGGGLALRYGGENGFELGGHIDFWLEAQPDGSAYRYQGDGVFTFSVYGFLGDSARGSINRTWIAGCLGRYFHAARDLSSGQNIVRPGCDLRPYQIQPTTARAPFRPPPAGHQAAAPPAQAFTVGADERVLALEVTGAGGTAPVLSLTDPKGRIYNAGPVPAKVVADGAFHSIYLPAGGLTLLRVDNPLAGEWTLTPQPGSPAIARVRSAEAAPAPKLKVRLTGSGRERTLTWNAAGLAGRSVRFAERGRNTAQTIAVTKKARGSARFSIGDGSAGTRTIEAQVTASDGMPAATSAVARFRAPGPPRPARPSRLRVSRRGQTVTVRWRRLRGAAGYAVRVTGRDGRKEIYFPSAKRPVVRITSVAPTTRLTVRVAGWTAARSITGPARSATVKPARARPRR